MRVQEICLLFPAKQLTFYDNYFLMSERLLLEINLVIPAVHCSGLMKSCLSRI